MAKVRYVVSDQHREVDQYYRRSLQNRVDLDYLFNTSDARICCPHYGGQCDGIPHIQKVSHDVKESTSGAGLVIYWECENGHTWNLTFTDHSGGTWLTVEKTPDAVRPRILHEDAPEDPF